MTRAQYIIQKEKERTLSKALSDFRLATAKLSQEWLDFDDDTVGINKYPFDECFREITSDIVEWTFTFEMEIFRNGLTEKAITPEDEED